MVAVALAAVAIVGALYAVFAVAPVERIMGVVQKIFYFHVPFAIFMGVAFVVSAAASLAWLVQPSIRLDALAAAAAEVGVLCGAVVLATGPLWARKAWGAYWTWEPRLTLSLLTEFIYVAYLAVRRLGGSQPTARTTAAALSIAGIPAYYFLKVAVYKWGGNHPKNVVYGKGEGLVDPNIRLAFVVSLAAIGLLVAVLVWFRYRSRVLEEELEALWAEALDHDLVAGDSP